ncbi:hypothetical protein GQ43DRAFT_382052 [Delitschia confertaspora ATCC 74209]|uniref:Rhodopsin domain-containing protein n=1 Tax=Delitschia confertaspora ATCC 74209 TaxID=1513339 RepID=A0A9P4MRH2_9PLEO|nr:hypothetical protein GQ43DRAFT_382052 [Delitschia confertaspora ATCC 74209]
MGPPDPSTIPAVLSPNAINLGHAFAGVAIPLNIIAFIVFSGRVWTRSHPVFRLQWDDYIFTVAYILVLVDSILLLATIPWVFNKDPATVTLADVQDAFRLALLAQPIWAWSMAAIKIGIAAMLLRLQQQANWRRFLWAMIVIQVIMAIYNTFAQLFQCIPLRGAWDLLGVVEKKCWSDRAIRTSSISVSVVNVATDIVFSLIPITFLRKVQRPLRERIIIGILMALGLFASGASIAKVVAATKFGATGDGTAEGINVGMWSCLEELVGFIAACIPCLKQPFQRVLSHFNLISLPKATTYGGSYGEMGDRTTSGRSKMTGSYNASRSGTRPNAIKLKDLRTIDSHSEEDILPRDEPCKGGEIWLTTEVQMEEERVGRDLESQQHSPATWSGDTHSEDAESWPERMHGKQ